MDVLSEVLKVVKLSGAVFYNAEFSAPWSIWSPASRSMAPYLSPEAGDVIVYHLVTQGYAWARLEQCQPVKLWTVASLAEAVGVSRSVLAERFRHYVGEPPVAYLTRWRLQLGARMLTSTSHGVAQIAAEVGHDSEAAFNRAFKRSFDLPPARFRKLSKSAARKTAATRV